MADDLLELQLRDPDGSRTARRLRREGLVPGVIYGADEDPQTFSVDERILRHALAHAHAIIEVSVGGGAKTPVLVKDVQRHPVRGEVVHLDLLRVNMNKPIQAPVQLILVGAEDAPGVDEGGILTQEMREVHIEALPGDIPDSLEFDVSKMEMNATATLAELPVPEGIRVLDDPETTIATVTPPSQEPVDEEPEQETELVGDAAEAAAEGATGEEAAAEAEASGEGSSDES